MTTQIECPQCRGTIQFAAAPPAGSKLSCPNCRNAFYLLPPKHNPTQQPPQSAPRPVLQAATPPVQQQAAQQQRTQTALSFSAYFNQHWQTTKGHWFVPWLLGVFGAAVVSWFKPQLTWRGQFITLASVAGTALGLGLFYSVARIWTYSIFKQRQVVGSERSWLARLTYGGLLASLFALGPIVGLEYLAPPEGIARDLAQRWSDKTVDQAPLAAGPETPANQTRSTATPPPNILPSDDRDLKRMRTAQTWAVVIGVGKYEEVPKLALTVNDAENVAQALITSGNVPIQNILRLTDAEAFEHQPTSQTLHQKIPQWLAQAAPQDTVIIFFAGHGVVGADGMYLAPQDVSMDDQAPGGLAIRNGMALTWLREQLGQCRAKVKLLWLDACHSGSLRSASLDGEKMARTFDNLEGVVTIASCKGSQVSLESPQLGGGLFSHYLVSGLEGEADANQDAKIDVDELYGFVHRSVSTRAKDFNAVQTPVRSIFSGEGVPVVLSLPQKFPTTPVENNQRPPQTTVAN